MATQVYNWCSARMRLTGSDVGFMKIEANPWTIWSVSKRYCGSLLFGLFFYHYSFPRFFGDIWGLVLTCLCTNSRNFSVHTQFSVLCAVHQCPPIYVCAISVSRQIQYMQNSVYILFQCCCATAAHLIRIPACLLPHRDASTDHAAPTSTSSVVEMRPALT
jgi:hypothetical protein